MPICPHCNLAYDPNDEDRPHCSKSDCLVQCGSDVELQQISSGYTLESVWGKRKPAQIDNSIGLDYLLSMYEVSSEEECSNEVVFESSEISEELSDSQDAQILLDMLTSKTQVNSNIKSDTGLSSYRLVLTLPNQNSKNPCQDILKVLRDADIEFSVEKIEKE